MINRKLAEHPLNYPAFAFATDDGWQMFSNTDLDNILSTAWRQPTEDVETIFDFKKNFLYVPTTKSVNFN